jgi:hypothetical protein
MSVDLCIQPRTFCAASTSLQLKFRLNYQLIKDASCRAPRLLDMATDTAAANHSHLGLSHEETEHSGPSDRALSSGRQGSSRVHAFHVDRRFHEIYKPDNSFDPKYPYLLISSSTRR